MSFSAGQILHGADYNPEQWLHLPKVLEEDSRLMRLAHLTSATIGIFSWTAYEPAEGSYNFDWMDDTFARLERNGQKIILATPTGAKPHWMAHKYPEIRRCHPSGFRDHSAGRHNHCPTSPVYREKMAAINGELAKRYGNHPALILWHLSNEYGGYCYCDLCFGAFREWLKQRYHQDLEALNQAYWSRFWSRTYTKWEQIDYIDAGVHGLALDWKRFMTHQTADFMQQEIAAVRQYSQVPVTNNLMGTYPELNYHALAPHLDVVSWDSYPQWGLSGADETANACGAAFGHDLTRALKRTPFLLMESTPSQVNWSPCSPLKRPGVHKLASLQAVAHGADGVMYFQWRKSQGASEKFHGAVVDHCGHENTRVFGEVAALGADLEALREVADAAYPAQAAVFYDWENRWAIEGAAVPFNAAKKYEETVREWHRALWERSVAVDVTDSVADYSPYRLIIAPMLHMLRPGVAERLHAWVQAGGTLVVTYFSGCVDENDLCTLGGFPGPLRATLGIWAEEWAALPPEATQTVNTTMELGRGTYAATEIAEIIHLEGARALASFGADFYAGSPAVTVNQVGNGTAYYVASRNESRFQDDFLARVCKVAGVQSGGGALRTQPTRGVSCQWRRGQGADFLFLLNCTPHPQVVSLTDGWHDMLGGGEVETQLPLQAHQTLVLRRSR